MKKTKKAFLSVILIISCIVLVSCNTASFEGEFGDNIKLGYFNPANNYSTIINNPAENSHYKVTINLTDPELFYCISNISGNSNSYDTPLYYYKYSEGLVFGVYLNELSNFENSTNLSDFKFELSKEEDYIIGYYNNEAINKVNILIKPYRLGQREDEYKDVSSSFIYNNSLKLQELISPIKIEYIHGANTENKINIKPNACLNDNVNIRTITRVNYNDKAFYNSCTLYYQDTENKLIEELFEVIEFSKEDEDAYSNFVKEYFKNIYDVKDFSKEVIAFKDYECTVYEVGNDNFIPCFEVNYKNSTVLYSWINLSSSDLKLKNTVNIDAIKLNLEKIIKK